MALPTTTPATPLVDWDGLRHTVPFSFSGLQALDSELAADTTVSVDEWLASMDAERPESPIEEDTALWCDNEFDLE